MQHPTSSLRSFQGLTACAAGLVLALAAGCTDEKRVIDSHNESLVHDGGVDGGSPCSGARCLQVERGTDKVDLLFMIDNSNSMREEQSALIEQMPALIEALSTGDVDGDGKAEYGAVHDLHLGVVSSDMGLIGISGVDNCSGFGDDGLLQHQPSPLISGCDAAYPPFLSYFAATGEKPADVAHDFACIATLGTGGCGFEQQLESPLKALWPSHGLPDAGVGAPSFLTDGRGIGGLGHGDLENMGFLRSDPQEGASLIGIILITDEDDGSSANTRIYTPLSGLDPNDPLAAEPLNLRNHYNQDELYPVERYVNGFKALRPGHEDMVIFGAITGVPPELVKPEALADADRSDDAHDAFYKQLLDSDAMQERIDAASTTVPGSGNLIPACETANGKAYPARRIVQTARGFGENGFVQSICEPNYRGAVGEIAKRIGKHVLDNCLPEKVTPSTCKLRVVLTQDGMGCADLGLPRQTVWSDRTIGDAGPHPHEVCNMPASSWDYDDTSDAAARCGTGARVDLSVNLPDADLYMDCER